MNYATFAALTNYTTVAAALAAKTVDGDAWLLNETQVVRDGTMPDSGPPSQRKSRQVMLASTVNPTVTRNKGEANKTGSTYQSTPGGGFGVNNETVNNTKTPAIRHKVSWYVTDSTNTNGYRRVFGVLEDSTTTVASRDDDAQVRL